MSSSKRVHTKTTNVINEHGEVLHTEQVHVDIIVKDEKEFFFVFAQHMANLLQLDGVEVKVLLWCGHNMTLNNGRIVLTSSQKDSITQYTTIVDKEGKVIKPGLSRGSISNAISRLVKAGIFIPDGRATYQVHPEYIWKGNLGQRQKLISVIHNYKLTPDETTD